MGGMRDDVSKEFSMASATLKVLCRCLSLASLGEKGGRKRVYRT
jgi:hypothetical protein